MAARKSAQEYSMAWIAALAIERSSAFEMLDEIHEEPDDFVRHATDENAYDWGRIHNHNIVITSLPTTAYGKVNAANTIVELLASLPHIKFGFLVGIGAGVPVNADIRLGDVVIGVPDKTHGGVIEYDFGKIGDHWEPKGFLKPPPGILLKALSRLQAKHESSPPQFYEILLAAFRKNTYWAARYARPTVEDSLLRKGDEVVRSLRTPNVPHIHYGTIASGDSLIKNATVRDAILKEIGQTCKCIEMEAAGMLNKIPCIVIRGISDYADSNKNDEWQRYASATAAAFAKELLLYVPRSELQRSPNAAEWIEVHRVAKELNNDIAEIRMEKHLEKAPTLLRLLNVCPYAGRKDRNPEAIDGTCQWFTQHSRFLDWSIAPGPRLLWVSADPGAGKSTLAKHLVDKVLNVNKDRTICYFFFKDDFQDQKECTVAICSVLRQLLIQMPSCTRLVVEDYEKRGSKYAGSFTELWQTFIKVSENIGSVICVFDGLDECQKTDRVVLIKAITNWLKTVSRDNLKFLLTSRPHRDIKDDFYDLLVDRPTIHLSGESDEEANQISQEIDLVIRYRINLLSKKRSLTSNEEAYLVERFLNIPHRTYLWAHLTLDMVETALSLTKIHLMQLLQSLPRSVSDAYEKMLSKSADPERTYLLFHILIAAQQPLTVHEVSCALSMTENLDFDDIADVVEPEDRFCQSMRDMCGLIVIVVDGYVYFLHQTVREFLESHKSPKGPYYSDTVDNLLHRSNGWAFCIRLIEAHRVLARACQRYLSIRKAESYSQKFLDYCNQYWPFHFHQIDTTGLPLPETVSALQICQYWSENYCNLPERVRGYHGIPVWLQHFQLPPLAYAAWFGFPSVVRIWLEANASLDHVHHTISWAMWYAVRAGRLEIAKTLLQYGANTDITGRGVMIDLESVEIRGTEESALAAAILNDHIPMITLLLENKASVNIACIGDGGFWYRPLHIAAAYQETMIAGYPRSSPYTVQTLSNDELPFANTTNVLRLLLKYGANPAFPGYERETALHLFLSSCWDDELSHEQIKDIIQLLLIPGSDINECSDAIGGTWLKFAALANSSRCMEVLIDLGASCNVPDSFGNTILHHIAAQYTPKRAVRVSCRQSINIALHAGVYVDSRNCFGQTPLMMALINGSPEMCLELIHSGADLEAKDKQGRTLLMLEHLDDLEFEERFSPFIGTWLFDLKNCGELDDLTGAIQVIIQERAKLSTLNISGHTCSHIAAESDTDESKNALI